MSEETKSALPPAPISADDLDEICERLEQMEEFIARFRGDTFTWTLIHIARLKLLDAARRMRHPSWTPNNNTFSTPGRG